MGGMDRHSELQQHKTAAEYRQAADEHVRTLKDFWKDFLVSGLFVLAAIVAIFACLAWFAANNRVSATGSTIGAKADRYIITTDTTGNNGVYDDGTGATFNIADSMDVSGTSNFNNETAGYLAPGASGSITFYVQWLDGSPEDLDVDITRGVIATTDDLNASAEDFKNLLTGHILFFKNRDDDGYYSDWVGSTYTVTAEEFNAAPNKKRSAHCFGYGRSSFAATWFPDTSTIPGASLNRRKLPTAATCSTISMTTKLATLNSMDPSPTCPLTCRQPISRPVHLHITKAMSTWVIRSTSTRYV